ncbi:PKD domain-containing protein [Labilibaculum euxinus]
MKKVILLLLLFSITHTLYSQNINKYEYWFDDNFTSRISVTETGVATLELSNNTITTGLSDGFHSVHFRFRDDSKRWSVPVTDFFRKYPDGTVAVTRNISKFEYWIDDDFASRIVSAIPVTNIANLNQVMDTKSLAAGFHSIHFRFCDDSKQWSTPVTSFFRKYEIGTESIVRKINGFEYWIDDNFADRHASAIPVTGIANLNQVMDTKTLATGFHSIHFRFRDDSKQWSTPVTSFFRKYEIGTESIVRKINGFEYWMDDDFNNRIASSLPLADTAVINQVLDTKLLASGFHSIHMRFKDDSNQWSVPATSFIRKYGSNSGIIARKITSYRYWFNDDVTSINQVDLNESITPFTLSESIHLDQLPIGDNQLIHFQFLDDTKQWSVATTDTINRLARVVANFTADKTENCGSMTVQFTNNSSDGETYLWDFGDGNTSTEENPLHTYDTAGSFTVSLTTTNDTYSLSDVSSITDFISIHEIPSIDLGADVQICEGSEHTFSAADNFAQYFWNNAEGTNELIASAEGDYTLKVIDANGCEATDIANLSFHAAPSVDLGADVQICEGSEHTFSAADNFAQYFWNNTEGTNELIASAEGDYTLKVIDANGCEATDIANLSFHPAPSVDLGADVQICEGSEHTFSAADNFAQYFWNNTEGTNELIASAEGDYTLKVVDNNGCEATDVANLSFHTAPSVDLGADVQICQGGEHTFSVADNFAQYFWNNTEGINELIASAEGDYTLKVIDANGCEATDVANLSFHTAPTVDLGADVQICQGSEHTFSAADNFAQYFWNNTEGINELIASAEGDYTLKVVDNNGCEATDVANLSFHTAPSVDLGADVQICQGSEHTFSVADNFAQYFWNNTEGINELIASAEGDYTLKVIDANGCEATDMVSLTFKESPDINLGDDIDLCEGETHTFTVSDAYAHYFWNDVEGTNAHEIGSTGTCTLRVENSNGCSAADQVLITVHDLPQIPVATYNNGILSSTSATEYQWYRNNEVQNGTTNQEFSPSQDGNYSVEVWNQYGCKSEISEQVEVILVGIEELIKKNISIYPNPTKGKLVIDLHENFNYSANIQVELFDSAGKLILYKQLEPTTSLDLTSYPAGLYFVHFINQNEAVSFKIVKQ